MQLSKQAGFTLVELVVTMTVAAVLVSAAIPYLHDMIVDNRLRSLNNQLVSSMAYIRAESIKRVYNVTMCPRNGDGSDCSTLSSFSDGWITFVNCNPDTNNTPDTTTNVCDTNGDGVDDAPETILSDTVLTTMTNVTLSGSATLRRAISYRPNGNSVANGTFYIDQDGVNRYKITIALGTGRITSCNMKTSSSCP